MGRVLLLPVFLLLFMTGNTQAPATVREYKKAFPTYPFSDPNPIPSFTKIYPYFRYDGFTTTPVKKEWKVVELENDYLKLLILPEVGGKIWAAIEKKSGQPFLYYNHTVKFRDVAMRGPWTSGGLEANYGIIGHTPNCATPVDYVTKKNADGSASCTIGVLDLLTRTEWRMEINLPKDKAYFTTASFWYNQTPLEQPYYHWMNAGIKAKGNLEFVYPGTHYLGHEGEYAAWPINEKNGKNISFYEQNNFGGYKSYHVFGKYTPFFGGYWHDDDRGMARYAPHDEKAGKKIWIWGLSRQGMIWEKLLSDTDGQYVEVQSGRLFNQNAEGSTFTPFKHRSFAPYSTDTWTEYWFPVMGTKGFVAANNYGALNLKAENGWLKIYLCPVQKIKDSLIIKKGGQLVYRRSLSLSALQTFRDSIRLATTPEHLTAVLGDKKLVYNSSPDSLSRPLDAPSDFDWQSAYGLYLQGKEFSDQKMYAEAEEKLSASLQKDKKFLPAITAMAGLLYRNLRYEEALALAKHALSIDTHDGAANYYYGLIQAQLNHATDAKDGFDLATLSPAYRSAAYTELAKLYLKEKDVQNALAYAAKAIDFNRYAIGAYEMEAIAFRYLDQRVKADEVLRTILSFDALNHFARFEKYLWQQTAANKAAFISGIKNELPQESFLELAISYVNLGCLAEAQTLLQLSPANAIVDYWLAYLQHLQGNDFSPQLQKANKASPAFVFPFRSETANVLQWAVAQTKNWKPKYYLALIYKDRNRVEEADEIFRKLGNEPDYAPFYAARATLKKANAQQAEADLQKAIALDKNEWRYHKLLAEHYLANEQKAKALAVAESFYGAHSGNYIIGMLYAKTLLLNGRYADSDNLLSTLTIIPFEGATEGRELYREAKLMQAMQAFKQKNYQAALQLTAAARAYPENLGVGKPYDEDADERLEDWLAYRSYEKMGDKKAAEKTLQQIANRRAETANGMFIYTGASDLVSLWALEKMGGEQKASAWLREQVQKHPTDLRLPWMQALYQHEAAPLSESRGDAAMRMLKAMAAL